MFSNLVRRIPIVKQYQYTLTWMSSVLAIDYVATVGTIAVIRRNGSVGSSGPGFGGPYSTVRALKHRWRIEAPYRPLARS
jgi:hypothetical protein